MEIEGVDGRWLTLAGVGVGYALATGLIVLAFFLLPYLAVSAL
jgi:hypothetical protein